MIILRKLIQCLSAGLIALACAVSASGQGCGSPQCSPNPVPCAHCTGTWSDNTGFTYNISSNNNPPMVGTYNVSGTMQASPADCSVVYQVSGTITQSWGGSGVGLTTLNLTGSNPSPSGSCSNDGQHISDYQYVDVSITNNGCDYASGSWSNSDGFQGNLTMTKPADIPDEFPTQTSSAVCWWDQGCGGVWPVVLFEDTIGSSKSMAGRQAYEWQGASTQDTCWFQGSWFPPYGLSGGGWYVGYYWGSGGGAGYSNKMEYDWVGLGPDTVTYYNGINVEGSTNAMNRVPCTMNAPQNMSLYTHTSSQEYLTDELTISIQQGWYGVAKNGVQAWRQYTCSATSCQPQ